MGRVVTKEELVRQLAPERRAGRVVVFTNGCFDLLHPGHVRYLEKAKDLGDVLVVGVNADASVRRLGKGEDRPLVDEASRAEVVAALASVDWVVIFEEDTPWELIRAVDPIVLVKGGDWTPDAVVGGDWVRSRGGRVEIVAFADGFSTTSLVERIRSAKS